ncbi:hypothetical protein CXF68_06350 [Tenacibaculum sp. Bg11-29]|uniref:hypothetical protein n=1 Tax=Tenacibaculum sp. Bg11-29 TaxID=2058306 RepID=UPI000C349667|nr:hypothetical protein [Tenacibaculum sp. Bg11-29]PKH50343.1 hypothetical protein CXF68_06350 [Tenacibaculum sp. Bg11-29]
MKKKQLLIIIIPLIIFGIFTYNKYIDYKIDKENPIKEYSEKELEDYNKNSTKYYSDDKLALIAQIHVKRILKAPSTAKFPTLFKSKIITTNSKSYSISSFVDSQNSFGAMIRNYYTVELKQNKNGEISLIDIKVSE